MVRKIIVGVLLGVSALFSLSLLQADEAPLENLERSGNTIYHYDTTDPVMIPTTYEEQTHEFRGVWVATVYNLNMPSHTSQTQYQDAFDELLDDVLANNMNAILFQVRPQNDAFYASEYAAFSKWLTGSEGVDPGWDVMEYMINKAHENGIEFHAWLNPYRVGNSSLEKNAYLSTLHDDNFAKQNPELVIGGNPDGNNNIPYILNPGEPLVKSYIVDVVEELMTLYDVDGIHFDDYFYPYSGLTTDTMTYDSYKEPGESLETFRTENINDVMRDVKLAVDNANDTNNKNVRFGISPFGIWASDEQVEGGSNTSPNALSSLSSQYADSKRWVEEEWVHYINPQIYWPLNHSIAPYADVVDWWASVTRGTNVDFYVGHSIANAQNWNNDEIYTQLLYNQKHPEVTGSVLYSAAYLNNANMQYVRNNAWQVTPLDTYQAYTLDIPTYSIAQSPNDALVYDEDVTLTFSAGETVYVNVNFQGFKPYTEPIVLTESQVHTVHFKQMTDTEVSKTSGLTIPIVKTNDTLPTITIDGVQEGSDYLSGAEVIVQSDLETEVAINFGSVGEFTPYTEPIVLTEAGNYYIRARTVSEEGIYSDEVTYRLSIVNPVELTEPTITIDGEYDGWEYTSETTVSFASDHTLYYRIHNGSSWSSFTEYDEPFTLSRSVTYTIEYYVEESDVKSETYSARIRMNLPVREDNEFVIRDSEAVTYYQSDEKITLPIYQEKSEEIRAIWVSTVSNIDLPSYTDEDSYKAMLINMLDTIKANHFNTVFFQVRPMNDALYFSELAPHSRYIMGSEGERPDFDILTFLTEEAHERDIELHAWLNPYRVATGSQSKAVQLNALHDDNFAKQNPDLVVQDNNGALILNPGEPEVIDYLEAVVLELMENYDLDGIHFDDYFYSYGGTAPSQDASAFENYNEDGLSLDDWRRDNVNTLVKTIYDLVEGYNDETNQAVKFGISPFGIWASDQQEEGGSNTSPNALSSYRSQYADSKKWVEEGWLHYILPQLYWEFEHSVAPYADLVKWWSELVDGTEVDLIIGHGFYRYAEGTWSDPSELLEQLRYNRKYDAVDGSSFFTYNTLNSQHDNVKDALTRLNETYWTEDVQVSWETSLYQDDDEPNCQDGEVLIDGECVLEELEPESNNTVIYILGGVIVIIAASVTAIFIRRKTS